MPNESTSKLPDRVLMNKLIHEELSGKLKAIAGYDEIIWKIRAGYLAILYGSLAILLGTEGITNWSSLAEDQARIRALLLLIIGFSTSAFLVDLGYLRKKVKVVVAYDLLIDYVISNSGNLDGINRNLLHISGEAQPASSTFRRKVLWNVSWIILPLYGIAPVLALMIF